MLKDMTEDKSVDFVLDLKNGRPLTEREYDVLRLLVEGSSNVEIAKELSISVHTAKAHVSSIMQKMGVNDRVCVAVKAVRQGLV